MRWTSLLVIGMAALFTACQTSPKRYSEEQEGHWQAKVLVKDKKEARSFIVNLDVNAKADKQLRMDVTAAMGDHVASLVKNERDVKYILVKSKKYYQGRSSSTVLKPILSIPLDLSVMENILFDRPIEQKNWTCTLDEKKFLAECKNLSSDLGIKWAERKGRRKTVFVEHALATLQMNFYDYQPKVENRADLFDLKAPNGFEKIKIQ